MIISTEELSGGRIAVFADEKYKFTLPAATWYSFGLSDGDDITEERLSELQSESLARKALSAAFDLIARRAHSEKQIRDKLSKRFDPESVDYTVEKLYEMGLLDDAAFASQYAAEVLRTKSWSPVRIRAELYKRGISRDIADFVLDELDIDCVELICGILRSKYSAELSKEESRKAVASLMRAGFSYSDIKDALYTVGSEPED